MSYSYLDVDGSALTTEDRQSSYYSYDAHGNVEWLVQDIPGLGKKHIRYEYDLISGKVLKVLYQEQTQEQFYHRYSYDEDNRLTVVETSKDGTIWEKDATYEYYRHGPLQRIELGEDRVQGVDYTYTIHGWLKGINHPDLTAAHDPGKDGRGIVPADAFGMALSYYEGDYVRSTQNGGLHQDNIQKPLTGKFLYNGNIASWTTQIQKSGLAGQQYEQLTAEQYVYDELNRIKSSRFSAYENGQYVDKADYATSYRYDGNGNILSLKRTAHSSALQLDNLTYHYQRDAQSRLLNNRLEYVTDSTGLTANTEDMESQNPGNYAYDQIGQLVEDKQEGTTISWNVYNKVEKVTKTNAQGQLVQQLDYQYDAMGNRTRKTVTRGSDVQTTYYVRDAQGNVLSIYEHTSGGLSQKEVYLYGSARLGVYKPISRTYNAQDPIATRSLTQKEYELTDHLGNVRAVISDYREGGGSDPIRAALRSYYNYYAFGLTMPGRNFLGSSPSRYGFNGKELDKEFSNVYDYGFRIYSAALGRFLSMDPLAKEYPWYTPYQ